LNNFVNRHNLNKMTVMYQHLAYILFYIKRENSASTESEILVQENTEHQNESMMTDRHENEETNATATTTPSQAAQCTLRFMRCKLTIHCNWGKHMNKDAEDKHANRTVRVNETGTQDTTEEYTQLDQTNGISNETLATPNATATPTQSPERQCQPRMMTREENMLPREILCP
jgi:hypothetical protein